MQSAIDLLSGPIFRAALVFFALGLARAVFLLLWELRRTYRRAGDQQIPLRRVGRDALGWLVPHRKLAVQPVFGLVSMAFHLGLLLTPVFLAGHVALVAASVGIAWPALPNQVATALTLVVLVAAPTLVLLRVASRPGRALSGWRDYALPLLVAVPFASGFLVMHPAWNPFPFQPTYLVHLASANLALILVPLTRLSHMAFLPLTQLATELAWHFPPDAGAKVGAALGKAGEPV